MDVYQAVIAHIMWKGQLRSAIQTGKSEFTVEGLKDIHACEFGKWLDSEKVKSTQGYLELAKVHVAIHIEASEILKLALDGKKNEAKERMKPMGEFRTLSNKIMFLAEELA
ncbi:MAG: hypothetical protein GY862_28455 [Gammaproteobacteria bacterium]|nr:hypothetical protein [Gammaproteobacteria bacterium]